jgi:hypothetical protein
MRSAHYVRWQDGGVRLGYLQQFPDFLTQGASLDELEQNLRDPDRGPNSGDIPGVQGIE